MTIEFISHTRDEEDLFQKVGQVLTRPWRKLTNGRTVHVYSSESTGNKEFVQEVKHSFFSKIKNVFWKIITALALPVTVTTHLLGKIVLHYSDSYVLLFAKYKQGRQFNSQGEYEAVRLQFHSVKLADSEESYPLEFKEDYERISQVAKETVLGENESYKTLKKGHSQTLDDALFELPSHMIVDKNGTFHLICSMKACDEGSRTPKAHVYSFSCRDSDYKEVAPELSKQDLMRLSWDAFHLAAPRSTFKHFHKSSNECVEWKEDLDAVTLESFKSKPEQFVIIQKATCQPKTAVLVCYREFNSEGEEVLTKEEISPSETFMLFIDKLRAIQLKAIGQRAANAIQCASISTDKDAFKKLGDILIIPKSDDSFEIKGYGSQQTKNISYTNVKALEEIKKFAEEYCRKKNEEIFSLFEKEMSSFVARDSTRAPSKQTAISSPCKFFVVKKPLELFSKDDCRGLQIYSWDVNQQRVRGERIEVQDLDLLRRHLKAIERRQENEFVNTLIKNHYQDSILPKESLEDRDEIDPKAQVAIELGEVSAENGSVVHTLHFYNSFTKKQDSVKIENPSLKQIEAEIAKCKRLKSAYESIHKVEGALPLMPGQKPDSQMGSWFLQPKINYTEIELCYIDSQDRNWRFSIDSDMDIQSEFENVKDFFEKFPQKVPLLEASSPIPVVDEFKGEKGFDFEAVKVRLDPKAKFVELYRLDPLKLEVECVKVLLAEFSRVFEVKCQEAAKRYENLLAAIKERFKGRLIEKVENSHIINMSLGKYYLKIDTASASVVLYFRNKVKEENAEFTFKGYNLSAIEEKVLVVKNCHGLRKELNTQEVSELLKKNKIIFFKPERKDSLLTHKNFTTKIRAFYTVSSDYKEITLHYLNPHNSTDVLTFKVQKDRLKEGIEHLHLRKQEMLKYEFCDSFFKRDIENSFAQMVVFGLESARKKVFKKTLARISKGEDENLSSAQKARYAEDLRSKKIKIELLSGTVEKFTEKKLYSGTCGSANEVYTEFKSRVCISDYFDILEKKLNKLAPNQKADIYDKFLDQFGALLLTQKEHQEKLERLKKADAVYQERLKNISSNDISGERAISEVVTKLMLNFQNDIKAALLNPLMENPSGNPTAQDSMEKAIIRIYWNIVLKAASELIKVDHKISECRSKELAPGDKAEKISEFLMEKSKVEMRALKVLKDSVRFVNSNLIQDARAIMLKEKREILKDVVVKENLFEFEESSSLEAYPKVILRDAVKLFALFEEQVRRVKKR